LGPKAEDARPRKERRSKKLWVFPLVFALAVLGRRPLTEEKRTPGAKEGLTKKNKKAVLGQRPSKVGKQCKNPKNETWGKQTALRATAVGCAALFR